MFTQGLDNNALQWVRQKGGLNTSRMGVDPIIGARNGSNGIGLPQTSKFGIGNLAASSIPISRTMPGDIDSGSESEDGVATDNSLDSSPQDERVINNKAYKYGNPLQRPKHYASDCSYTDVSSSREINGGTQAQVKAKGMYPTGWNVYREDEFSDSAASSHFSTTQARSARDTIPKARANTFSGNVGGLRVDSASDKIEGQSDDEIPSAPPFQWSTKEHNSAANSQYFTNADAASTLQSKSGLKSTGKMMQGSFVRTNVSTEGALPPSSQPPRVPHFHASALSPWHAVIAYDACVRLCLNAWARGCSEAPLFLENECSLLRDVFSLQQVLLQSEEELLAKKSTEVTKEGSVPKPKKTLSKMKVQVRKVKTTIDPPIGCNMLSVRSSLGTSSLNMDSIRNQFNSLPSALLSRWHALQRIRLPPRLPSNGYMSRQSKAYLHKSTQYLKQVPGLLKDRVTSLRNSSSSYDAEQETYSCLLRMKSSAEEDAVRMLPGSSEEHIFFPDSAGDDLIIEVQDSKGKHFGCALIQVATLVEDPTDKLRWWSTYREPEHELVGKIQLHINYSTSFDDNNHQKYGIVAETVAYDLVLEVAMKKQKFQQRNLLFHGPWKWLLTEFASYYGVSDAYTRLRYLSYIMDVATPTADCLMLVHDLLVPVLLKGDRKGTLSHQENRILGETKDQINRILGLAFENYKSLDESSLSGIMDVFRPATGIPAPALEPAIKLYTLLHDILSPEVQTNLCRYFQVGAKKRSKRHLAETDEYITSPIEGTLLDTDAICTAYQKMTSLCMNFKNEIFTDIQIHNQHVLPSFVDLPSLSSAIYSTELCNRLRSFLIACPPSGPSPPVAELIIATTEFQRDLGSWKISPVKGGVDAKELFHLYILVWIKDKTLSLLETCKLDKVKWAGVRTPHSTTPFIDDMYDRLRETLNDYEVIICRWPEYVFVLENAVADVEKAITEALEKQYADVLLPLKENLTPKMFGLKYVQKLAKRSVCPYLVPDELGILLNSMKRMLDILRLKIESQFKTWGSCMPISGNTAPGERLSEVTVMLRTKFRNYLQAVAEKLAENTKLQPSTKLKKILQDSKGIVVESDVQGRMQPLVEQLRSTMSHLHPIFDTHVFVPICRVYWDRMGQDVLSFLDNRKENRSWYKGSRIAVSILDDTFASELQHLLGNSLQPKDIEPPRCIMEVRSILCKEGPDHKDNSFYY